MHEEYSKYLIDIQKLIGFADENNMSIDNLILSLDVLRMMKTNEKAQKSNNRLRESDDVFKKIIQNINAKY